MKRTRLPGTPEPHRLLSGAADNQIAVDTWGQPENPPVILLHGGGQTRHAWKGTGEILAASGFYALSFDARGHGDSDWTRGEYGHDMMADDLSALIAGLELDAPVLVGASMGGLTSLNALGSARVKASALILVDIAPTINPAGADRVRAFMSQKPEGFESLEEVADAISSYQPQRDRPRKLDGLAKNIRLGKNERYYWHWDPTFLDQKRDPNAQQAFLSESARGLSIPTLLVRGGMSDVLSEEGAAEFLSLCPHAEYANVTEAAHMVAGDRNDLFTDAVISFLQRRL